ncbi:MAG: FAD-binding protein, partial [Spirochaetales bacterium]
GILVNQTGDRFTNEHMGYSELAPHVLAQPGNYAYMIINQDNATQTASFESYLEKNIVISANTAEELAEKLNLNTDIFLETVREYQEGIVKGEDRFNRTNMPAHFNGPYHAIKITGDIRHTQGGLVTDIAGHVLREDGSLIKGLYAAGGVTESFSSVAGPGYMSGNGLLQAFVFGREAGFAASKETPNTATVVNWVNENQPTVENTEAVTNMVDTNTLTYKDGTYEGVAKGQYDGIKVQVKVVGGKVDSVVVLEHFETEAIYATAYKTILSGILANNGSSNVDAVTGATNSSKGILEAVNIALKNAL